MAVYQNPGVIWRVGYAGTNTNGGGYDPSLTGGTDYSQQDSAQHSWTNLACTGSASTTLTDASATGAFTSAMKGNAINLSGGSGYTAGFYFVSSYTDSNNVVLDRTPASSGSAASGGNAALGGRWADPWFNYASVAGGQILLLKGQYNNDPPIAGQFTTADFTRAAGTQVPSGASASLPIKWIAEPGTIPTIKLGIAGTTGQCTFTEFVGLYFIINATNAFSGSNNMTFRDCVIDNVSLATTAILASTNLVMIGCEVLASGSPTPSSNVAISNLTGATVLYRCFFHDLGQPALTFGTTPSITDCVFANNSGTDLKGGTNTPIGVIAGCSFINNPSSGGKYGLDFGSATSIHGFALVNNSFSGYSGASQGAILCSGVTGFDVQKGVLWSNNYWNCNTFSGSFLNGGKAGGLIINNGVTVGASIDLNVDPLWSDESLADGLSPTEWYQTRPSSGLSGAAYPTSIKNRKSGAGVTVTNRRDIGALQHVGLSVFQRGTNLFLITGDDPYGA